MPSTATSSSSLSSLSLSLLLLQVQIHGPPSSSHPPHRPDRQRGTTYTDTAIYRLFIRILTHLKITRLQQQLVSHSQRVSHLEYCLLATLDFLDSTRTASANELRLANERCARLQQKISQLKAINSAMENEKDDLRNSVVMLIEKGSLVT